jgi:hypothetical protein
MAYRVRWQLVGRSGQPLDGGCIGEGLCAYGDALAAVVEFLRLYPEVSRCPTESSWRARRSSDADLAVWIWIERRDSQKATGAITEWTPPSWEAEHALTLLPNQPESPIAQKP